MHLVGVGRIDLVNYSTCLHRLARVMTLPAHSGNWNNNNCNGGRQERREGGPGHCQTNNLCCWSARSGYGLRGGPRHVCLGGEQRPGNWAMDINNAVGRSSSNEARETEDVLGTIAGGGGEGSAVASTQGGGNGDRPRPHPLPCLHCGRHW
jgi:hypothetical protein